MAWIRQLPSGLWAATVRTGTGPTDRITKTHRLKGRVETWAADQEADLRRGDWIDPRKGEVTVGEWWQRTRGTRHQEQASRRRDESHWRCHTGPRWEREPIGGILKTDVSKWVVEMQTSHRDDCPAPKSCPGCRVGAATIEGAVGVLRGLLDLAIDAELIRTNPAQRVRKPKRNAHVDRVLAGVEERQLLDALDRVAPDRPCGRMLAELMLDTGMRWEEAAAIPPELVDTRRQRIHIAWVMERDGTARPYAKSDAGNRTVSYGEELVARIVAAKLAAPEVEGVFPRGGPARLLIPSWNGKGPLLYPNWRDRVWRKAITGVPERPKVKGHTFRAAIPGAELDDPQPTAHDLRHTFGTRLADEGVPVHDIMALMGHADIRSAQRYMHSREERFDRARQALRRARSS